MHAVFTNVAGRENYTTISELLVCYRELELHLDKMKQRKTVAEVAVIMLTEIKKCFAKLLDTNDEDHDPLYMVTTLLDPRFKALLNDNQIQYARKECLKYLMSSDSSDDCANTIPQTASSSHCIDSDMGPLEKCFKSDDLAMYSVSL